MGDETGIEWTDSTWNPTVGCTKISAGCDHCYAETFVNRFAGSAGFPNRFDDMLLRGERFLNLPLTQKWSEPRRIFVNSLSDLFHDDVPDEFIAKVFAVMAVAQQHVFQLLTKRHARMRSLLNSRDFCEQVWWAATGLDNYVTADDIGWPLCNVWLGVSVENQQWADIRIPALLDTPAAIRFLSCEPLLDAVDLARVSPKRAGGPLYRDTLRPVLDGVSGVELEPALDWVIVGGESGGDARPMHPEWVRSLRDQCNAAGVPFLFKQWGEWAPDPRGDLAWKAFTSRRQRLVAPDGSTIEGRVLSNADHPGSAFMTRVGKKASGRELDGRTWDQYPAVSEGQPE